VTHLTPEELTQWHEHGGAADSGRIVDHLAICDECGSMYAQFLRTRPADSSAIVLNPADFIERGCRVRRHGLKPSRLFGWRFRR
jgi:hypothetical protein